MQILKTPFMGTEITIVEHDNKPYVAVKAICDHIGLAWNAQFERLNRDEVLKSTIRVIRTVAEDSKDREMVCIPLNYLNGWLFGISLNRIRPELKNKLIQYKKECYEVLWDYWATGIARRDEIEERLYKLKSEEQESVRNGSEAGRALNKRKQEKAYFESEFAKLKQMNLFTDI